MRVCRSALVVFLSAWLGVTPAVQARQVHVADQAALDRAVAARAEQSDADRQAIRRLLSRPEVREIAARAGIDLARATAAVAALDGDDLRQIAEQARTVDGSLAAGASKVTLSTTTIIIGLLILILLIVAIN